MMDLQSVFSNEYGKIYGGLVDLSRAVRAYSIHLPEKLRAMEEIYLQKNPDYTEVERKKINYFREAFTYKFYLTTLHLEEIWSIIRMSNQEPLLREILTNIFDSHQFTEDDLLLPSFAIEGFIIQGTAYLDFYMLYMCSLFKINETNHLSGKKFIKALEQVNKEPNKTRAEQVKSFIADKVFGENKNGTLLTDNWGEFLRNLRNSLVHRDMLYPNFQNEVPLMEIIIGKWPEKEVNLTCSRFAQDVQNVMFDLITKLAPVVYGLEYKPGPYKPGMW